jgi:hypothetical protein
MLEQICEWTYEDFATTQKKKRSARAFEQVYKKAVGVP